MDLSLIWNVVKKPNRVMVYKDKSLEKVCSNIIKLIVTYSSNESIISSKLSTTCSACL